MRKVALGFVATLLAAGCATTPPDEVVVKFLRGCLDASEAQKQAWAYSQDLLIPLTGSDTVARVPDNSPERKRLSEAFTNATMQDIMIGMEMTRAGCPDGFIGTAESQKAAYSETGKTKPSWPSANEPSNDGSPVEAE